jgi:hypothetical protein
MKVSELSRKHLDTSMILIYIGLAITIATFVLYILMRSGHATPVTIEDLFAGFMVGQIFFNFGIVLEVSRLRKYK